MSGSPPCRGKRSFPEQTECHEDCQAAAACRGPETKRLLTEEQVHQREERQETERLILELAACADETVKRLKAKEVARKRLVRLRVILAS